MHGSFPLGRPNTPQGLCPEFGSKRLLVLGLHPSALRVRWWERGARLNAEKTTVLPVDVEPVPFWDGQRPDRKLVFEHWKTNVSWTDRWGQLGLPGVPDGARLDSEYLLPLGVTRDDAAFTYVIPWFVVEENKRADHRAIAVQFDPVAIATGMPYSALPTRPDETELRAHLRAGRGSEIRREICSVAPEMILVLGQGTHDSLRNIADAFSPAQERIKQDDLYGEVGTCRIDDGDYRFIATIHPEMRSMVRRHWTETHQAWIERRIGDPLLASTSQESNPSVRRSTSDPRYR